MRPTLMKRCSPTCVYRSYADRALQAKRDAWYWHCSMGQVLAPFLHTWHFSLELHHSRCRFLFARIFEGRDVSMGSCYLKFAPYSSFCFVLSVSYISPSDLITRDISWPQSCYFIKMVGDSFQLSYEVSLVVIPHPYLAIHNMETQVGH